MSQIEDLKKSITGMDEGELRALLLGVRQNRRVSKKPPTATKVAAAKKEMNFDVLLAALKPEEVAKLLANLTGDKK